MAYATPADLASYLQRDVDTSTAELLLELAAGAIDAAVPTYDVPSPVPSEVKRISLQVAARGYGNPYAVHSEAIGGESYNYESGGVSLTAAELRDLRRVALESPLVSVELAAWRDTSKE